MYTDLSVEESLAGTLPAGLEKNETEEDDRTVTKEHEGSIRQL